MARSIKASLLPVALSLAAAVLGAALTLSAKAGGVEQRVASLESDRAKLDRMIESQIKMREDIAAIRAVLDRR